MEESSDKERDNVGMLLISPLFIDLSSTQKKEISAINDRKDKLLEFMTARGCELPQGMDSLSLDKTETR